ncbi:MAG: hypothetical protein LBP70_00160 [Mycoplasmataceae bacterium]|nr:hypothetical protein [Mycoplasmataceae bacterium]
MPAIIIAVIGALLSVVLMPIAFAMSVWAPMIMGNAFYTIYTYLGGAQLSRMFFGTTADAGHFNFAIDWQNPYVQFLLAMLIIGVIGFGIFCGLKALTIFTSSGKRYSIGIGRLAYGIVGVIGIPVIFTIVLTVANMLFTVFSPDLAKAFITTQQIAVIKTYIDQQLSSISSIVGQPVDWQGSTTLADSLDKLITQLNTIYTNASQEGNSDLAASCSNLISELNTLRPMCEQGWWTTLSDSFDSSFTNISWASGGNARAPDDWWNSFSTNYNKIFSFQSAWVNFNNDLQSLVDKYSSRQDVAPLNQWLSDIKGGGTITANCVWYYFSDWTPTGSFLHLSVINQLMQGLQDSAGKINDPQKSLNYLFDCANPTAEFTLFVQIFHYTTGSSSNNWKDFAIYYGAGFELWRMPQMIMGAASAVIIAGAMYNYGWYMCKRVIDLAILWATSIWFGFTDLGEGIQFRATQRLIWSKIFSIVIIQAVFMLVTIVMNMNFFSDLMGGNAYASGALLIGTSLMFGAGYYGADAVIGLAFNEPGTLASISSQMQTIRSSGQGVAANAQKGTQNVTGSTESIVGGGGKITGSMHDRFGVVGRNRLAEAKQTRLSAKAAKGG